jgi:hypothetical protein
VAGDECGVVGGGHRGGMCIDSSTITEI